MRDFIADGGGCGVEGSDGVGYQFLMADAGEESGFWLGGVSGDVTEDGFAEGGDAFAGQGGGGDACDHPFSRLGFADRSVRATRAG